MSTTGEAFEAGAEPEVILTEDDVTLMEDAVGSFSGGKTGSEIVILTEGDLILTDDDCVEEAGLESFPASDPPPLDLRAGPGSSAHPAAVRSSAAC